MTIALNLFYPDGHEKHFSSGHPERPARVDSVVQGIIDAGLWDKYPLIPPAEISDSTLFSVHTREYISVLEMSCRQGAFLDADTYTTSDSMKLALNAAGGGMAVAESIYDPAVRSNDVDLTRGFAITRPPGHHATHGFGMGFCLLNNIAIAAEHLIQQKGAQKIAIVDLDLHHGNGTQDIFWERDDVLYISTHQSPLYPGTGQLTEVGSGKGEGYTANFPLPPGTGDVGYRAITEELIIPLIDRFGSEIILVSYGFDPHWRDPLGHLQLSASGYGGLIKMLCKWADMNCGGKIVLFLEGGYDLEAGYACTQSVIAAMLGIPFVDPLGPSPRPEGGSWQAVARNAHQIWLP